MKAIVSVCIPAYNQPELLKKAIDSVLMQTYTDYELIISDDSTTDLVKKAVEQYTDSRITYIKNEKPLGSPENWNNAMRQARGEYIKLLHHDDYFSHKDSLLKFMEVTKRNPEVDFVFCYSDILFKQDNTRGINKPWKSQLDRLRQDPSFLFFRNIIGAPSATLFKNNTGIFFNTGYKWLVDVEFYITYLKKHPRLTIIHEPLITTVDGSENQVTREVSGNKTLVIGENLALFSAIYHERLNNERAWLFFQELFESFGITKIEQLTQEFTIPENLAAFIKNTFDDLPLNSGMKKINKRLLTSRYNKRIFKIERF